MFLDFFLLLKNDGLPVSLKEYLLLLESLEKRVVQYSVDDFYYLARTIMVKHEQYLDRYDVLFSHYFKGTEYIPNEKIFDIPKDWLDDLKNRELTDEEKALIEAMGGLDELQKRFEELLNEQNERHEGGNRWIGSQGTSPFGQNGYNPEGFRVGPNGGNRKAVKIWQKRSFRNLNDKLELNTRNLKMALRRLRVFTREGHADELDLDDTINKTCHNGGLLDLQMVPSKENRVKVLLFLDVGGSMDDHILLCSQLFSAAKYEFKNLEFFYFHNCLYEYVWKDNIRRYNDRTPTFEVLHKYNKDYKVIVVGDAYMSPYEVLYEGGSIEHYNKEPGLTWLNRLRKQYPHIVWLNPNSQQYWHFSDSTKIIRQAFGNRMFPMTIEGLSLAMKALKDKKMTYELGR